MSRRKEPAIPNELLDQLLAGGDAGAALAQGGLLDALKKALTERALNAEMDHHLASDDGAATRATASAVREALDNGAVSDEVISTPCHGGESRPGPHPSSRLRIWR